MQNNDVCVIAFQKMENMNLHFYCLAALLLGGGRGAFMCKLMKVVFGLRVSLLVSM